MTAKSFDELQNEILSQLRPSKILEERLSTAVDKLLKITNLAIENLHLKYEIEPILVGSIAKDTYLENPDIDIFIMFPVSVPKSELREIGLLLGHTILPGGEERYAEHPYISGSFAGFDTDLVPCYKLDSIEDKMTAVDRTPFHTRFIIEHLEPKQHDEVRLLKQFIKGIGAYGAEIEVLGFSGYLCELLILRYGTFLNLLKGAIEWPLELVLDLNNESPKSSSDKGRYQPKTVLSDKLSNKFKNEPLVFIDPVDTTRNVASALESENLKLFITAANKYLTAPRREFFFPNTIPILSNSELKAHLESNPKTIVSVRFETPEVVPDILHGQLRKCQRAIQKLLDTAGFDVEYTDYYVNHQTLILFELESEKLADIETHVGPPKEHENVKDFIEKWNNSPSAVSKPYQKDNRWLVDIKREFTTPLDLLKAKLIDLSIGKHITLAIKKNVEIYQDLNVLKKGYEKPLTHFLMRKYPWEY